MELLKSTFIILTIIINFLSAIISSIIIKGTFIVAAVIVVLELIGYTQFGLGNIFLYTLLTYVISGIILFLNMVVIYITTSK